MRPSHSAGLLLGVICCLALYEAPSTAAQDAGGAAPTDVRRLYESADYEQALHIVDLLLTGRTGTADEQRLLQRYRALCLLAVGRTGDAEATIEALLHADPLFMPDAEAPPRLTLMVTQVRERIARTLVTEAYQRGRARFAGGDTAGAGAEMTTVLALLDDPDLRLRDDPFFDQLRVLADGFKTLSAQAATAPRDPPRASAEPPTTATAERSASTTAQSPATAVTVTRADTAAPPPGFVTPRALSQAVPRFTASSAALTRREGEIAVDIATDGSVSSARMTVPISPTFDPSLLDAAKHWRYEPARRLGVPVPYTLRVRIVVAQR